MEVQIDSKRNNPLLSRTEVHFTVKHEGEKTPNREIVRSELAEKLNAKKENIVVNFISPGFGTNETTGYAKVYSSVQKAKDFERNHMLTRNKLIQTKKGEKKEKPASDKPAAEAAPATDAPEPASEVKEEQVKSESAVNDSAEPAKDEGKPDEPVSDEKKEEKPEDKQDEAAEEQPAEEKKE